MTSTSSGHRLSGAGSLSFTRRGFEMCLRSQQPTQCDTFTCKNVMLIMSVHAGSLSWLTGSRTEPWFILSAAVMLFLLCWVNTSFMKNTCWDELNSAILKSFRLKKKVGAWDKILFVKSVKAASLLRNILFQCYSGKLRLSVYYPVKTGMVFDNCLDHKHYVRYSWKTGKNIFHKQENVSDQVGNIRKPLLYWLNHKKN